MKSLMLFLQEVLHDMGNLCGTSTSHDLETVMARVDHEGLSFLTISLPEFGKDFERSLDQGQVSPSSFAGFSRRKGLPRFLGGFLDLVFDRSTGRLLDEPSIAAIQAIRQITLMFGKIDLKCSPAREDAAIRKFIECEKDTREADASLSAYHRERYYRIGTLLWADLFSSVDLRVYRGEIIPKHGPGATADRLQGNSKWRQYEWTERLEGYFPCGEYLLPNWSHYQRLTGVQILDPGNERPVRVVTVPKTLKSPRIIAIEPTCMQYVQQGLLAAIREEIDRRDTCRNLVGWASNVPNQHAACHGSRYGTLATLDLSEASDRVSNQHVRGLLRNHRHLQEAVDSCRSRKADVRGYGIIPLAKFASMGSALTFPFESLVFMTLIFCGIEESLNRPLTHKDIESFVGSVRCYGDDIIVPVEFVQSTIEWLEAFGLKVNSRKSFWTGKFRESCGKEYYDGEDVSIVRVRSVFPSSRTDALEIVRTVALRNHLYHSGMWRSAAFLDRLLERIIPFPNVTETSPVLGRHSYLGYSTERMCDKLHRPLVRGMVERVVTPASPLDDIFALNKVLITSLNRDPESLLAPGDDHLARAGRPKATRINLRWATPY